MRAFTGAARRVASLSIIDWRFTTLSVEAIRAASNAPESISKSRQPTFG